MNVLQKWHDLVKCQNSSALQEILADEVIFFSPVVHTPQVGKAVAFKYLAAAMQVFGNESFRYVREIVGNSDAVLEFETEIAGIIINGVDMIKWNHEGKIVEFKVMVRPLKAINLIHAKMAAMLQERDQKRVKKLDTLLLERLQNGTELEFDINDVRTELSRRLGKKR